MLAFFTAVLAVPPSAVQAAVPTGAQVVNGNLNLSINGNVLNIDQLTPQAIANWQSFSIDQDSIVNIQQLDQNSVLLNRVVGADPSSILGQISANGRVYLINPNGIVVGKDATINTAQFIASALDISDEDFLDGDGMTFEGDSMQSVVNLGKITADNGDVYLIAHKVQNQGTIEAKEGVVALGAGNRVTISPESDHRIFVQTDLEYVSDGNGVDNSGVINAAQVELKAAGGNIYELAINQTGIVQATGVETLDGRVILTAEDATVAHSGAISAQNQDGTGGVVMIGGSYPEGDSRIKNAARTIVTEDASIDVSSHAEVGDGGLVVVGAEQATRFLGKIEGQGGALGGNGGTAVVSGKSYLDYQGIADLSAASGEDGTLTIETRALTINTDGPASKADPLQFDGEEAGDTVMSAATLAAQLELSHVSLESSLEEDSSEPEDSSIIINEAVAWSSGNDLTLESKNSIFVNDDLDAGTGKITFGMGFASEEYLGGPILNADLIVDASASITAEALVIRNNKYDYYVGNSNYGGMGEVDINGILNVNTLDLHYLSEKEGAEFSSGSIGGVFIDNAANKIGTFRSVEAVQGISGGLIIVDSEGGLTIDGQFDIEDDSTITTFGDVTLSDGTALTSFGNLYLAAQGGAFINQSDANALKTSEFSRFLVYSADPADTVKNGLVGAPVYNKTYSENAPDTITQEGNRFLYSLAPVLKIKANDLAKTVGDDNPTLSYTISGLVGDDQAADVFSGSPLLSTSADASSPIGEYTIDLETGSIVLSDYNYGIELTDGILSVEAAALIELLITANDFSRYYGDANPTFTARYDGLKSEDDASVVTGLKFTTTANAQSSIGNYTITPYGASATDYNISYQSGKLTVNPRLLTIQALDLEKVYGNALPAFGSTVTGLASFDDLSDLGSITYSSEASLTRADVGKYTITPAGASNPNYAITFKTGQATVTPRSATIKGPSVTREYGLENPTYNPTISGFLSGDFEREQLSFNEIDQSSDVGNYTLTPFGYTDPNYTVSYENGSLQITKATLYLAANSFSRQYGLENPEFTYTESGYRLGHTAEDVFSDLSIDSEGSIGSSVGVYSIDLSANLLNTNYNLDLKSGKLTITKAPLVVAPKSATKVYGEANPDFDVSAFGLRNGDTTDVIKSRHFQVLANEYSSVGNYVLSLVGAVAQNYDLTFNTSTMRITPRDLTITANNATREYGEANPDFTASFDGLTHFDDASVIPDLVLNTPAQPGSIAQTYGINATYGSNPNYNITFNQGFLEVTKAPLSLSLNNVSRLYGDGNGVALGNVVIDSAYGFKLDDGLKDLKLSDLTTSATQLSDVGNYLINGVIDSDKYEVTSLTPGVLTVTPRPFSVLIDLSSDERVRRYGDAGIDLTGKLIAGNLVNGDTLDSVFEVVDPTQVFTPVGEYAFSGNVIDSNYTLSSFGNTKFVIQQRGLDLVFSDASRVYGGDAINLWNYLETKDLFVAGDTAKSVLSDPTANVVFNSGVGEYPISVSSINSNYFVDSITGALSITPRPLFVYLNEIERVFGNANPSGYASYRIVGGANDVLDFDSLDSVLTVNAPASTADVGKYALTATMLTENYDLRSFEGNMNITPRQISVKLPESVRRVYGDNNPAMDPFVVLTPDDHPNAGLASFHEIGDVLSWELPEVDAIPQVLYLSDVLNQNSNYKVDFSGDFVFRIDQRPISLRLPSYSRLYGDENPEVALIDTTSSGASRGLASFDSLDVFQVSLPDVHTDIGSYKASVRNSNYAISLAGGNVQIDPRILRVSAVNKNHIYGEQIQGFSVSELDGSDGFASFDDYLERRVEILIRDEFDATTEVGSYQYINEGFDNYVIDLAFGGELRVKPRPVELQLPGFTRIYGNENPEDAELKVTEGSAYGLASFHTMDDVISLGVDTPTIRTNAGVYNFDITSNPNYALSFVGESAYTIQQRSLYYRLSNMLRDYGENVAVNYEEIFKTEDTGIASFDRFQDVVRFNVPGIDADVGRYTVTADVNDNYSISLYSPIDGAAPYVQVEPRYLWVDLIGYDRLYGEQNVQDEVKITRGSLPSFASLSDVFELFTPSVNTPAGEYTVSKIRNNKNYTVTVNKGDETMTISPRRISMNIEGNPYGYYGDINFAADFVVGGDGLAPSESFSDGIQIPLFESLTNKSNVGYYLLDKVEVDTGRYILDSFVSAVFTILPRQLQLNIKNVNLSFDTTDKLIEYLDEENLVVSADVENLPEGETIDDAFPIIRYQIVDGDVVPQLPIVPTMNNIVIPTVSQLSADESWIGEGVTLSSTAKAPTSAGVTRTSSGLLDVSGEINLSKYLTVLDGFDTEDNYVLAGVNNGSIRLKVPNTISNSTQVLEDGIILINDDFEYSTNPELEKLKEAAEAYSNQEIVVTSGPQKAPTLDSLFKNDNYTLGMDMIMAMFESLFAEEGADTLSFEEGSLFYEITRSTEGGLEDLTPFRIQRWFERNANEPDFMTNLAGPLAVYSQKMLSKDPSSYTSDEAKFVELLGEHMGNARDQVAARMEEKKEAWIRFEEARGSNLADLFGKDVPWSDFMSEAAGDYVADNLEAKVAGTAAGSALAGAGAATGMAVLTSFVMPFAFGNVATGVGTSIAAGTSLVGASAGALVAVPAAIVAGAVVGSVARGIQVFENADQKAIYDEIQAGVGQDITVSEFSLQTDDGKDNALNQSIFAGALASLLYGE